MRNRSGGAALYTFISFILSICFITACAQNAPTVVQPPEISAEPASVISAEPQNAGDLLPERGDPSSAELSDEPSDDLPQELPSDEPPQELPSDEPPQESPAEEPQESPSDESPAEAPENTGAVYEGLYTTDEPGPPKTAYITIDDGPSRKVTPGILDYLMQEDIKATFFVLPHEGVDDIYQRIIDEGHELASHSYSHVYAELYRSSDLDTFRYDAIKAREFIYDRFGYTTISYRFPGGAMGRKASIVEPRIEILNELGYRWFDWNVLTGDADKNASRYSVVDLANNVLANTRGRDHLIVLMHDTYDKLKTLEALPLIIEGLRAQNYSFEIISNYPADESQP